MSKVNSSKKINEWLFFVDQDLKLAHVSLKEKIYTGVCFHAQQAVEKALKAYILKRISKVPKIHRLTGLLDFDPKIKNEFLELMDEVEFLDQFYIPTRYPEALPGSLPEGLPNQKDAENSLKYAEQIVTFVKNKLSAI